jgi:hypothetical protein
MKLNFTALVMKGRPKTVGHYTGNTNRFMRMKERDWVAELGGIISSADSVRAQMLELIPRQRQTTEDQNQAQVFAHGVNDPESFPTDPGAAYLERLALRVPPPQLN